jgi:hypothetical protein
MDFKWIAIPDPNYLNSGAKVKLGVPKKRAQGMGRRNDLGQQLGNDLHGAVVPVDGGEMLGIPVSNVGPGQRVGIELKAGFHQYLSTKPAGQKELADAEEQHLGNPVVIKNCFSHFDSFSLPELVTPRLFVGKL